MHKLNKAVLFLSPRSQSVTKSIFLQKGTEEQGNKTSEENKSLQNLNVDSYSATSCLKIPNLLFSLEKALHS